MLSVRQKIWPIFISLFALVASCAQPSPPTTTPAATPLPAIALRSIGGTVKAAGKVAPGQVANLSFVTAGQIRSIAVQVGDTVQAGDLLLTLDNRLAEIAVQQAEAAVQRSRANVALLMAEPRAEEVAAAQANLAAAQARLAHLQEGALPAVIAAAQADLVAAQEAHTQLENGATEQARINARTVFSNSLVALQQAQAAFDQVAWRTDAATLPEGRQLQLAINNYQAAQALYANLNAPPTAEQKAVAVARIQQAEAALARLQAPTSANQVAEAEALVRVAQVAVDQLKAGPQAEAILAASATVSETEAAFARTQADLLTRQLIAPFAGTVIAVDGAVGEVAVPGQTLVILADLSTLQVETTDLSERDVARVAVGQGVKIVIEASGEEVTGRVIQIAAQAAVIGGDVVFPVTIVFDHQIESLLWGMSVQVEIAVD